MVDRCSLCGETGRLNTQGVCRWRSGCDHRVMQHEARVARLEAELALLDPLDCGHTPAEHARMLLFGFGRQGPPPEEWALPDDE